MTMLVTNPLIKKERMIRKMKRKMINKMIRIIRRKREKKTKKNKKSEITTNSILILMSK